MEIEAYFFDTAKKVYSALVDDISKKVYSAMIMFNLTRDMSFVSYNIKDKLAFVGSDIPSVCRKHEKQPIAIFGAGWFGSYTMAMYPEIHWCCCVDNYKMGTLPDGTEIISIHELKRRYPNAFVVVAVRKSCDKIVSQLQREGIDIRNIYPWANVHDHFEDDNLAERQYFDLPALKHEDNEVFVDAGGFDGETSRKFMKWSNNKYKHIYVFEVNPKLYTECCKNLSGGQMYNL